VVDFADYAGRVVLVVNVASGCGFAARQLAELEQLRKTYGSNGTDERALAIPDSNDAGFEVLAFPSNQFKQEPQPERLRDVHGVTFPVFAMVS
jgi:glutathione peroxidase